MESSSQQTPFFADCSPSEWREQNDLHLRRELDQIATLQSYQWLKKYSSLSDDLEYCAKESIRRWANDSILELLSEIWLLIGEEHPEDNYRRAYAAVHDYATRGPTSGYPSDELAALGKKVLDQWLRFELNRSFLPKLKELKHKELLIAKGKESGESRRKKSEKARARALELAKKSTLKRGLAATIAVQLSGYGFVNPVTNQPYSTKQVGRWIKRAGI